MKGQRERRGDREGRKMKEGGQALLHTYPTPTNEKLQKNAGMISNNKRAKTSEGSEGITIYIFK